MSAAALLGLTALSGLFGAVAHAIAPFIALAVSIATAPLVAKLTDGRYYLARKPRRGWEETARVCTVCDNTYAGQDTAYCPAYGGVICSLCCTLDARCHDACKPHARYTAQIQHLLRHVVPASLRQQFDTSIVRFLLLFALATALVGTLLLAIFTQLAPADPAIRHLLGTALVRTFFVLAMIAGPTVWLLVLAHESRTAALDESRRQSGLLLDEIGAHKKTDAALQKAKQAAESANLAKSRFVIGVSHELRAPLNAVLGYAQLLELDPAVPAHRHEAVRIIRRSGEHLACLIEGLLDISKIEAGRIILERRAVRFDDFLEQIVDMFRLQAEARGLGFTFRRAGHLAGFVHMDETRLRQVLINLLSNAIKFTRDGGVSFMVRSLGETTEFEIGDTGVGIAGRDLERIFHPFERISSTGAAVPGTGLGLTITKLLTEIMGGEISVTSEPGAGSIFRIRLLLSEVSTPQPAVLPRRKLRSYAGRRRTLIAADDDAVQRALLEQALTPLGFALHAVPDGQSCLRLAEEVQADAVLLDMSMPEMDGLSVARRLRMAGCQAKIIIISGHPEERSPHATYDAFLPKPLNIHDLVDRLGALLGLEWENDGEAPAETNHEADLRSLQSHIEELRHYASIGHVRALRIRLDDLVPDDAGGPEARSLRAALSGFRLDEFIALLDRLAGRVT